MFPIYIFAIVAVIVVCAKWSKFLQRIVGSQIVPVLTTLSLLLFTKLIRNVIQALHFKRVLCDSVVDLVWFVEGNINYVGFPYYILFTWALIVLAVIVLYTSFLLATPLIERYLTHLKCFRRYTKWYLNVLEIAFLLNLILLGYVATAFASEQQQHLIYTSLLLVISFLLFFGIILYHIHLKVKPNVDVKKYYRKYKIMSRAKSILKKCFYC